MTRNAEGMDRQWEGFLRHGICGCYSATPYATPNSSRMDAMDAALDTRLPLANRSEPTFDISATGGIHSLATGGVAVVIGRPRFQDKHLHDLAGTEGDAVALARGYTEHSEDIFKQIGGSFGCIIIDTKAARVLMAIDRMGQQTLCYHASEDTLYFGSSAGSLLASVPCESSLYHQGIYNYVYFHMVPCPVSVYQGLHKLPAAHYLDFQNGRARIVNYWRPVFSDSTTRQTFPQAAKQLKKLLESSVGQCLDGAGKTGAFLSGGLDSSTVAGILAESGARDAEAYSIGFAAEGYDEMAYARIAARHFNIRLNEYYVTPQDVVDALPLIATSYDEPFGNSSALPAYFCAKLAAEHGVHTLLAGDGGDELFAGNERYVKQRVFEHYANLPAFIRRGLIEPALGLIPAVLPLISKAKSYISQANTPLPDRLQSYNFLHRHAAAEIFSDEFLAAVDVALPLDLLRSIYQRPAGASDLNRMLYLDWQITLADNDLRKVSQMCALAGVDVAYPMLNDELVDFSCLIPSAWKIKGRELRHFYKQALKGWLPQETIEKTKQGFGLPFGVWMRTYMPLRELAYDNLIKLKNRGLIRPAFIDKTIRMHQSEHAAYYGELVWILAVFELWMQGHRDTGAVAGLR